MSNIIPQSLNWMINKRARLAGKVIKLKKKLAKVQPLIEELKALEKDLNTVDEALKLHEIQVDLDLIKPIRPTKKRGEKIVKFQRGVAGKIVMDLLRSRHGQGSVTKTEIMDLILEKHLEIDSNPICRVEAGYYMVQIMARLRYKGYVISMHSAETNKEGSWVINPKYLHK
jgi:hypothetical protein